MEIKEENFYQELCKENEKALEYVIDNYGSLVKTVVKRHLPGLGDYQEECMNDVFLAVWQHCCSFRPEKGSFAKWLAGVSRYKALTYKRKYLREQKILALEEIGETGRDMEEFLYLERQLSGEIEEFIQCLKEEDREIFRQVFVEEMTPDEVARKQGISKSSVYTRVSRGKKKIRNTFQELRKGKGERLV